MASDYQDRKPLRPYADLFKSSSSSSNHSSSSWESSSLSGFSSPFGSELASSSESDDGDFAFELSRQMAEFMLQEEEQDEQETDIKKGNPFSNEASGHVKNEQSNLNYGHGFPPLEVYQLRNQPPTVEAGPVQKTEHRRHQNYYRQKQSYKGRNNGGQVYGSGMQAIFLGGNGSGKVSSGTGVFLPRAANDSTSVKRKPQTGGCSTVLIPTRVLHALELHFNRLQESKAQPSSSSSGESHNQSCFKDEYSRKSQNGHPHELKNEYENKDNEDMRLPQEWTY